jgi:hypothetical protein
MLMKVGFEISLDGSNVDKVNGFIFMYTSLFTVSLSILTVKKPLK